MVKDLNDPTNVDSVPAMLTPGEYVLNKEATNMYGPLIEQMNQHGLLQRKSENAMHLNTGAKVKKLHNEGYTAPGQAYAIAKSMGYNTGGLVNFIQKEEGWRDKAYQDPGGVWTIGFGRTQNPDGSPIQPGQTTTKEAENKWLGNRLNQEREAVKSYGQQHGYQWNDNQVDALASFRYNGGQGMLEQLTGGGQRDDGTIASKMLEYNKQSIDGQLTPLAGLTKRRQQEAALFAGGEAQPAPQPQQQAGPLQFAQATQQKQVEQGQPQQEQAAATLPTQELASLALGRLQGRGPVAHQTSRQFTAPEYIPLVNKENKVQTLNDGGRAWWNPLGWFEDDEMEANETAANLPPPNSDESLLQFSSGEQQRINGLPIGHPERVSAIESGQFIPTEGDLDWDEQRWRTNEELHRAQLQAAVTAPDAPGAEFQQNKVNALTDQLDSLGVPAVNQGVGTDVFVGGPDQPPLLNVPELGSAPNEVGAVPGLDPTAPLPQDVIDNTPEGLFGDLNEIQPYVPGGEEFQGIEQAIATDSYVSAPSRPDLAAPEPEKKINVETASIAEVKDHKDKIQTKINEVGEAPPSGISISNVQEAGQKAPPAQVTEAKGFLQQAFGDLFNPKELARAAILMAGGMATGMSSGQALAFAGTNYLNRVDAQSASDAKMKHDLIKGGKYTTESIEAFSKGGDASVLIPTTQDGLAAMEETGQIKDFFSPQGKITGRQVKVGENKVWVDKNNKPINIHEFNEDPSNVRGTPEYRTRINSSMKVVENSLKDLKESFGAREGWKGDVSYATDIIPSVQAGKVAEWAAKNGVRPEEVAGLVESAYHDALNSNRQDGARVRDLVPYLNQLVIRQSVGGSADVFRVNAGEAGPPQYIDTEKMAILNRSAGNLLRQKGFKGGSQDLANQVYTAAITDWNGLDEDAQKEWNRKANKGENGFYHYVRNKLNSYL